MCGLIGVTGTSDAAREVFVGLMNLQHRGQDGAGILTHSEAEGGRFTLKRQSSLIENVLSEEAFETLLGVMNTQRHGQDSAGDYSHLKDRDGRFTLQKGSGLVENVLSERAFKSLRGQIAVGHTRYATIGRKDPNLLQPFLDYTAGIGLCHNGNIVNVFPLQKELASLGRQACPQTESDSEVILKLLSNHLLDKNGDPDDLFEAISFAMQKLVGSYSVVGLTDKGLLFAFRDPNGIRPLVMGSRQSGNEPKAFAIASETVALKYLGYNNTMEIQPGGAIVIDNKGNVNAKILQQVSYSPCMFEWVYFARVESDLAGTSVYQARFNLGLLLAERLRQLKIEADVVVPVPETSRAAAIAISEAMSLPFRELLIKNRYVNRTFILDGQEARQEAIRRKLFPIASEIKGKRCLVVDDSIVRGNTASQIIELLKQSGAKDVTLVSTCPPIRHPCFYGIDFPSQAELVAANNSEEQIAAILGADRVVYQTQEGLIAALEQKSLCTGCLTGNYPTDISSGQEFELRRLQDRSRKVGPRS